MILTAEIPVYLSLGSNLGDRMLNLNRATRLIGELAGSVRMVSRTFASESWGYASENGFYNRCILLGSSLEAEALMQVMLQIERSMGRSRNGAGYADRLIDIDLLIYGNQVIDRPGLTVPHPKMMERRFVLVPLSEIAPEVIHPASGNTIKALLELCEDPLSVRPV